MLIQLDGSHHDWLEDRGPKFVLMLAVDDATSAVVNAVFCVGENIAGYFTLPEGLIEGWCIPLALYSDRHAVFKHTRKVSRDNTVQYQWRTLQLLPSAERPSYAGVQVEVLEHTDGRLQVRHEDKIIPGRTAPPRPCVLRAAHGALAPTPEIASIVNCLGNPSHQPTPVSGTGQLGARSPRRGTGGREPSQ